MHYKFFKKRPERVEGVSLLIAIIFVSAMLLLALGIAETSISGIRDSRDWNNYIKAKYAAEGVLNLAMQKVWSEDATRRDARRGRNISGTRAVPGTSGVNTLVSPWMTELGITASDSYEFEVTSRPKTEVATAFGSNSYYSIPSAETGDVSAKCIDDQDIDGSGTITSDDLRHADNPCHWNKLILGETQEIPLYYTNDSGTLVNPIDVDATGNALNQIKVRVRTPCKDETKKWCADSGRIELYPSASYADQDPKRKTLDYDDTLVYWSVVGEINDLTRFADVLFILQGLESGTTKRKEPVAYEIAIGTKNPQSTLNSEIYASEFNSLTNLDNIFLDENTWGGDIYNQAGSILKFITNQTADNRKNPRKSNADWVSPARVINKPYLQLQLVAPPRDADAEKSNSAGLSTHSDQPWYNQVPYLEYQVLTNRPVADEKVFGKARVCLAGFCQTKESAREYPAGTAAYAFEEN